MASVAGEPDLSVLLDALRRLARERGNPFSADRPELMIATGRMTQAVRAMLLELQRRGLIRIGRDRSRRTIEVLAAEEPAGGSRP